MHDGSSIELTDIVEVVENAHLFRPKTNTQLMTGSFAEEDILVSIRDLVFFRDGRKIFDGVDMDISRGKVTAIMGPSGTGKTTLLKLIGGQLRPGFRKHQRRRPHGSPTAPGRSV